MIVTIFRSRLKAGDQVGYLETSRRMSELACTMPGYVSHKTFTADDGERVTIVEFEDEASQRAWAANAEHVVAQRLGREVFYSAYSIQVCTVTRQHRFAAS